MTAPSSIWEPGQIFTPEQLTPNAVASIQSALTPGQTMGLTAWAEARARLAPGKGWVANPIAAMVDIIEVIDHRARDPKRRWPGGHKGVCLGRWQFSCWEPKGGPDDPRDADHLSENFEAIMLRAQQLIAGELPTPLLMNCIAAAEGCLAGALAWSFPEGTTHYYAEWLPTAPKWAAHTRARLVAQRHGHLFFANVP